MNRSKRMVHAWTWTLLAVAIAGFSLGALVLRAQADNNKGAWVAKASPR